MLFVEACVMVSVKFGLVIAASPMIIMALEMKPLVSIVMLMVLTQVFQSLPNLYHGSWLRLLREGDNCGKCDLELCSQPENCLAGTVLDHCGCCSECGNREGQICDLDGSNHFYGQCGQNLQCILNTEVMEYGEVPEPQCVCGSQESVCGPEGKTYENICQFNEIYSQKKTNVSIKHKGPCESDLLFYPTISHDGFNIHDDNLPIIISLSFWSASMFYICILPQPLIGVVSNLKKLFSLAPVISLPPQNTQNFVGNDILFRCEVSAYPIPYLEWKKKGDKIFLPGDDAHISIQVRGGPQKYGVTGWLQIQAIRKSDEGVYICHTRNKYGTTYASARLKVINPGSSSRSQVITRNIIRSPNTDYGNYYNPEEEYESGDYEEENKLI
ncbi:kazal-type serine protease inhibitor domain-containing protein 1-like [Sarcophilus harrisii]|uniref:kazal-type serine protease inhibitor domain-containing protein 1-like n=1 Tax=Sarcophilus harrisii TaxID=9305 RepID=UPI001301B59E|nr:kazal-type serine protease inhibitor domain-containing protein 1-like [Sarcophilus harrisii]